MRSLSPKSKDLLERLREPALSLKQVLRIGDSPASVLDQLGQSGEPLSLVHFLPFVFDKRRSVARAAARAAAAILTRVPIVDLPWLDERLRQRSGWESGWFDMTPADLQFQERFGSEAAALLRLAACQATKLDTSRLANLKRRLAATEP